MEINIFYLVITGVDRTQSDGLHGEQGDRRDQHRGDHRGEHEQGGGAAARERGQ